MQTIELLAPAKDLACGMAAIDHGADAVYIGAARFGARQAAGNSLDDIAQLCAYAHQFGASVHVTVNTLIYDNEMEDTLRLVAQLDRIGVDAILVQDMGLLARIQSGHVLSRAVLHASTQCDTRTAEKVRWLQSLGFSRAVLARELSVEEISAIHRDVADMELEAFVHGALCVSYSGLCYASQYCFQRSANRGACAQFCRLAFDLKDDNGTTIVHDKHLLSLKDLCQIDHLEELMRAGVCSLKIEGRLKDASYVKNVVAAYSQRLDEIIARHPGQYCRSSRGRVNYHFQPNLSKTFNRGYTTYFATGRQPKIFSPDTPKALGEYVGKVKDLRRDSLVVAGTASFANGDGLCFINDEKELEGFRVNRVEGNRLYPLRMPEHLRPGMALYRNNDQAFENILSKKTASRKIPLHIRVTPQYSESGVLQQVLIEIGASVNVPQLGSMTTEGFLEKHLFYKIDEYSYDFEAPLELARRPQGDNIRQQLSKMGNTIFECDEVVLAGDLENYFIPNSILSEIRRDLIETATEGIQNIVDRSLVKGVVEEIFSAPYQLNQAGEHELKPEEFVWQAAYGKWPYLYNIANRSAEHFYKTHGMKHIEPAFEVEQPKGESLIMQCRHCIRYSLGYCVKRGGKKPQWKEPLFLELGDGRRFRLEFNCAECQMNVYSTK